MSRYCLTRDLNHIKPRPLSYTARMKLHAQLDEWYATHGRFAYGMFTDLCEQYRVHPQEMETALRLYRDLRYRAAHGGYSKQQVSTHGGPPRPSILDEMKPFAGWGHIKPNPDSC